MPISPIFQVWRLSPVCLKDTPVEPVFLTAMSPAAEGASRVSQGNLSKQRTGERGHCGGDSGDRERVKRWGPLRITFSRHGAELFPGEGNVEANGFPSLSLSFLI